MAGKLIVIDGLDGSGKSTQIERVTEILSKEYRVKTISFPDYANESSALVRMYLGGAFGDKPDDVNAYAASSFYAVDRYASYKLFWEQDYQADTVILAARYTTSNAIHQMSKLPKEEWDAYLAWLASYEYDKLGLPRPNGVIFLNMSKEASDRLLLKRYGGDESKKDVHERDQKYQSDCRTAAEYAAKKDGWTLIECCKGEEILPIETITEKILEAVEGFLK